MFVCVQARECVCATPNFIFAAHVLHAHPVVKDMSRKSRFYGETRLLGE